MSWRSQNENYGAFLDSRYERTSLNHLPTYGSKDGQLEQRRNKIKTTTGNYGSFYKPVQGAGMGPKRYTIDKELIPIPNPRLDERYMVSTHDASYNHLQQANASINLDRRDDLIPPIPRQPDLGANRSPRREVHQTDRMSLREVSNVELSLLTKDLSTVKIVPQGGGNCSVTSYPDGLSTVYHGDVKEVNIKVQNRDGSYTNIVAVPKKEY